MKLIVGLGNPGREYENHRHNLGFKVIDSLAKEYNIDICHKKFKAIYGKGNIKNDSIVLVKPLTYMNLSGESVIGLSNFFKISIEDILVIADDLNIDFGRIRIRKDGSDGGHNGLKSIISCLGSKSFPRIRLGIGLPKHSGDVSNYVLSQFNDEEKKELDTFINKAKDAIVCVITDSIEKGMNQYNS